MIFIITSRIFGSQMKKFSILLLTAFYILVASGFAINSHYCGGKLKEISFLKHEDCCCGSTKKAKKCCKDETIFCKIQDNQKLTSKIIISTPVSIKELVPIKVLLVFFNHQTHTFLNLKTEYPPPPEPYSDPVFLLNRNFRI